MQFSIQCSPTPLTSSRHRRSKRHLFIGRELIEFLGFFSFSEPMADVHDVPFVVDSDFPPRESYGDDDLAEVKTPKLVPSCLPILSLGQMTDDPSADPTQ